MYNDQKLKPLRQDLRKRETDAERKLWYFLRGRRMAGLRFFRQYSAGPYILDFFCPKMRVAIELDGGQHNDPDRKEYDAARTSFLQGLDIQVVRFWNSEVSRNIEGVLDTILAITPPASPCFKGRRI